MLSRRTKERFELSTTRNDGSLWIFDCNGIGLLRSRQVRDSDRRERRRGGREVEEGNALMARLKSTDLKRRFRSLFAVRLAAQDKFPSPIDRNARLPMPRQQLLMRSHKELYSLECAQEQSSYHQAKLLHEHTKDNNILLEPFVHFLL